MVIDVWTDPYYRVATLLTKKRKTLKIICNVIDYYCILGYYSWFRHLATEEDDYNDKINLKISPPLLQPARIKKQKNSQEGKKLIPLSHSLFPDILEFLNYKKNN